MTQEPEPPDPVLAQTPAAPRLTSEQRAKRMREIFATHEMTLELAPEDFERLGAPVDPRDDGGYVAHLLGGVERCWSRQLVTLLEARAKALGCSRTDARHALPRVKRELDRLERIADPERFVANLVSAFDRLVQLGDGTRATRHIEQRLCDLDWPRDQARVVAEYAVLRIPLAASNADGEPELAVLEPLRAVAKHWLDPERFAREKLALLLGERPAEPGELGGALPETARAPMQDPTLREWAIECFAREIERRQRPMCQACVPATPSGLLRLLGLVARHATDSLRLGRYHRDPSDAEHDRQLQAQLLSLIERRVQRDPELRHDAARRASETRDWNQRAMLKLARATTPWNGANSLRNHLGVVVDSTRPKARTELRLQAAGIDTPQAPVPVDSPDPDLAELAEQRRALVRRALSESALAAAIMEASGVRADISDKQRERFAAKARGLSDKQIDPAAPGAVRRSLRLGREKIVRPFMQLLRTPPVAAADQALGAAVSTSVDASVDHVSAQMAFERADQHCYDYHFGTRIRLPSAAAPRFDRVRKTVATPLREALRDRKLPGALLQAYDAVVGHSRPGRRSDDERAAAGKDDPELNALLQVHFKLLPGSMMQTMLCELWRICDRDGHAPVANAIQATFDRLDERDERAVFETCFMLPLALCASPRDFPDELQIEHHLPHLSQLVWHNLAQTQIDSAVLAAAEPFFGVVP